MEKLKQYFKTHEKEAELIRYVIAGGLTTLLSFVVFSAFCMAVAPDHTVNGATQVQASIGQVLSWIIAVLFAFFINRRMVFLRQGGDRLTILKELAQFVLSRLFSGVLFELGLFNLLAALGVSNVVNKLIVLVLVTVFNYVVSKFWIFAKKTPAPATAPGDKAPEAGGEAAEEPTKNL